MKLGSHGAPLCDNIRQCTHLSNGATAYTVGMQTGDKPSAFTAAVCMLAELPIHTSSSYCHKKVITTPMLITFQRQSTVFAVALTTSAVLAN
jgi:hypothetical protein